MKAKHTFLAIAVAASLVAAGTHSTAVSEWFSQTFANLADGTPFMGEGAVGGAWHSLASGAATVRTVSGRKCIDFDAKKTSGGEIQFRADEARTCECMRFDVAVCLEPVSKLPTLQVGDKGGLCLLSTNQVGVREFAGYTTAGWRKIYGRGLVQHRAEWIDCRAEFEYATNGVGKIASAYVTYYENCSGQYVPLVDTNGVSRFAVPVSGRVSEVAFRGSGHVGDLNGFELGTAQVFEWVSGGGYWDDPENWSPSDRVPGEGDIATVGSGAGITCTNAVGEDFTITTEGDAQKLMYASGRYLQVIEGSVYLQVPTATGCPGSIIVNPNTNNVLRIGDATTVGGIEMGWGSTLALDSGAKVIVSKSPLYLDGVNVRLAATPDKSKEAVCIITAPYGSGGVPASLAVVGGEALAGWSAAWHGNLDGTASLWLVNEDFNGKTALWGGNAWGNLLDAGNWATNAPKRSAENAARMGSGGAFLNATNGVFSFARTFEIGAETNATGKVSVSGGTISGGAVVVGTKGGGTGAIDVMAGQMLPGDYLWTSALTIGAETNSPGIVRIGVSEVDGKNAAQALVRTTGQGGLSVGTAGAASMEIGCGPRTKGMVEVGGPVAVGYDGELIVSGGSLVGKDSFYIGRTSREAAYDVTMTVSDGVVSNVTAGIFWVGSYGGIGSKAAMTIMGGEVYATNLFVCGGYRSATVTVAGGSLVTPEIRIGHALVDDDDRAAFVLSSGRVATAGFTAGSNGIRTVALEGGRIIATSKNDDFFAGIETVQLTGAPTIENESNIVIRSALTGAGGLVKTGMGTNTVAGYAAWAGPTVVAQGVLDMDGGMVMGELSVADGASVVNEKYADIDALALVRDKDWDGATTTTSPYLLVQLDIAALTTSSASVAGEDGVTKGAVAFVAREDGSLSFAGWTALGWTRLNFRDGTAVVANADYQVQMKFDFAEGKPYAFYYAMKDGAYERLFSDDGLTAFPVAGEPNAKTFSGLGAAMTLGWQQKRDAETTFLWTGVENDVWTNASNWSRSGTFAPAYPNSQNDMALVEKTASIRLSTNCVGALFVTAPVSVSGDWLSVWKGVSGAGTLKLGGATISGQGPVTDISVALDVREGTENEIAGTGVSIYGSLRGAGGLSTAAKIYGDTREFAGDLTLFEGGIYSVGATHNALSSWTVADSSFAIEGVTYEFGALEGSFVAAADCNLVVGAKDVDCRLGGSFAERSGLEWIAKTAALEYSVTNAAYLKLSGGGKIAIASDNAVPASISFAGAGGELSLAPGVGTDVSGVLVGSSAAITFNDGGSNCTWAASLSASNRGGFVKRGNGTLKWLKAPESAMDVTVEEGVLEVPFGTALGYVTVLDGACIVVDMTTARLGEVAFSAKGANRKLAGQCLSLKDVPVFYDQKFVYGADNSVVVVGNSANFVWTGGAGDKLWTSTGNWTVDGTVAKRLPQASDAVVFQSQSCTTVRLEQAACAMKITGSGSLHLEGDGELSTVLSLDCPSGNLGLDGTTVACGGDLNIRSLYGNGVVSVSNNTLTVSPTSGCTDVFEGVLNITNLVKQGRGCFRYVPASAFDGVLNVEGGSFVWDCAKGGMTNQLAACVTMGVATGSEPILDLAGQTVAVKSFMGSGTVMNGVLVAADGVVTQLGGGLTMPLVAGTRYIASRSDERLVLETPNGANADIGVTIVIPRSWYAAGSSGRRAIKCDSSNIYWGNVQPVNEGDGWWSIPSGGFAIRLR